MSKYIFVTGGVTSSLGKGIIVASLAKLFQSRGFPVSILKLDPYINVDPDTLNPYEHGECYVTDDGAVTDLDLGHYERFLGVPTSKKNNVTTGKIYSKVIEDERNGKYNGKTVQVVPHITDEIKRNILHLSKQEDNHIVLVEIGGTVGDIESLPYLEAVRQIIYEKSHTNTLLIHLTLIPYLKAAKEIKTKPTQHSVKILNEHGLIPNILVCRTEKKLTDELKKKIALFCNVPYDSVIEAKDVDSIYEVPLLLMQQNMDDICINRLGLTIGKDRDLDKWNVFVQKINQSSENIINIGLIGKYTNLQDAYKSILEAFVHSGTEKSCKVNVLSIESSVINDQNVESKIKHLDGILIAPGFGIRGFEGKIIAINYARTHKVPFLGICLGMQMACLEFSRNVLNIKEANSEEFDENTSEPIIVYMPNQSQKLLKGATMRLGAYNCELKETSLSYKLYGQKSNISERHRHRFEFNNLYKEQFEHNGLIPVGYNKENNLVEIIELQDHPFFIGVQFHPELKSTVENPHPLFLGFVQSALEYKKSKEKNVISMPLKSSFV